MLRSKSTGTARFSLCLAAAIVYAFVIAWLQTEHEMWRDELQDWLLARDSQDIGTLFSNMRYQGHPGLWNLLLWVVSRFTTDARALQLTAAALAGASAFLVLRFAPFPLLVRVGLLASYTLAYEWGVIARMYALSAALVFAACALAPGRERRPLVFVIVLTLLAATTVHGTILAIAALVGLIGEALVGPTEGRLIRARTWWTGLASLGVLAAGIVGAITAAIPPADSPFTLPWILGFDGPRFQATTRMVVGGFLPLPSEGVRFWGASLLPLGPAAGAEGIYRLLDAPGLIAAGLVVSTMVVLVRHPGILFVYGTAITGLLLLFYVIHPGNLRNHVFLFMSFVAACWLADAGKEARRDAFARARLVLLSALIAVQVVGAAIAIRQDWQHRFSGSKAAALWIRENIDDLAEVRFAGYPAVFAMPVVGQLPVVQAFYPERDETGVSCATTASFWTTLLSEGNGSQ